MALRPAKLIDKRGHCFWCGTWSDHLTADHVPPKLIFPKRVHASLPWVPACEECNKDWEQDAEYFRDFLLLGALGDCKHPELIPIRQKFERAQEDREKLGHRRSVFSPTPMVVLAQGLGDGLGPPKRYAVNEVDLFRIGGIVVRTVAALHGRTMAAAVAAGKLKKMPLLMPEGYRLSVCDVTAELYGKAIEILKNHGRSEWGDGLLQWVVYGRDESPEHEFLLGLYKTAVFHARIHPIGAMLRFMSSRTKYLS
jgi:hypothetical protein